MTATSVATAVTERITNRAPASAPYFSGSLQVTARRESLVAESFSDVRIIYQINPRPIGDGNYGVVRKCMHRETMEWYAIKSIRKSKVGNIELLRREVDVLKELDHPNIIKLVDVHEDRAM